MILYIIVFICVTIIISFYFIDLLNNNKIILIIDHLIKGFLIA